MPAQTIVEPTANGSRSFNATLVSSSGAHAQGLAGYCLLVTACTLGADRLGDYLDEVIELTRQTYRMLRARDDLDVLMAPALSTLVFRYRPVALEEDARIEAINRRIRQTLSRRGEAVVAATRVDGRFYLKFTLLNPMTRPEDLTALISEIADIGASLMSPQVSPAARPSIVRRKTSC